jgi:hypothetical protein
MVAALPEAEHHLVVGGDEAYRGRAMRSWPAIAR